MRDDLAALALAGFPVGTSTRGAFWCETSADFRRAYRNLYGRLREQAKRCRRFKETFRYVTGGQRTFDFARADAALEGLKQRAGTLFPGLAGDLRPGLRGRVSPPPKKRAPGRWHRTPQAAGERTATR